jgi:hypothetical protein
MTGEAAVEACGECPAPDHVGDGPVAEPDRGDPAVAGDGPEGWAGLEGRGVSPGPPGSHRACCGVEAVGKAKRLGLAFLVGLGAAQDDAQAVVVFGDVADVEANQLAPAQRSGEAK